MKNLYKIEDELYIISNTENVDENCWIITDGKLVQVSYLLSDEVAKGNKVILTTNKLLIKDGVQDIDDKFLEWFVENPSCEYVEVDESKYFDGSHGEYIIIIPQEEPKQETLEEAAEKWVFETNGHKWSNNDNTAGDNYGSFKAGAEWQAKKSYSEEDLKLAYNDGQASIINKSYTRTEEWFEQNKKK
jgi:hypothetical protein